MGVREFEPYGPGYDWLQAISLKCPAQGQMGEMGIYQQVTPTFLRSSHE
jgi:hypothetical protein